MLDKIEGIVTEIINKEGVDHLQRAPFKIYQRLLSEKISASYARLVLTTLTADAVDKTKEMNEEELSKDLQKECFLRKKAADEIAAMYKHLLSDENQNSWKNKENAGFDEFCDSTWEFEWEGSGQWRRDGGYYDCWATVEVDVKVADRTLAFKFVEKVLKKNPFTDEDTIFGYFRKEMEKTMEIDLEEYITSDDYYPPVMEDYSPEYELEKCCKKLGLKIVHVGCTGEMSDWEHDGRR